ncbi:unnamed protein product, partial [Rotaria magnacalcarata]
KTNDGRYDYSRWFVLDNTLFSNLQQAMIILGSREECDRSGRGLELAIRTDAESETEFTLSTQNKVEPHNGDSNSSSTAKLVKPTTTNSSALSSISGKIFNIFFMFYEHHNKQGLNKSKPN